MTFKLKDSQCKVIPPKKNYHSSLSRKSIAEICAKDSDLIKYFLRQLKRQNRAIRCKVNVMVVARPGNVSIYWVLCLMKGVDAKENKIFKRLLTL